MEHSDEENGILLSSREEVTEPRDELLREMLSIFKDLRGIKKVYTQLFPSLRGW